MSLNNVSTLTVMPLDLLNIIDKYAQNNILRLDNVESYMLRTCWWSSTKVTIIQNKQLRPLYDFLQPRHNPYYPFPNLPSPFSFQVV